MIVRCMLQNKNAYMNLLRRLFSNQVSKYIRLWCYGRAQLFSQTSKTWQLTSILDCLYLYKTEHCIYYMKNHNLHHITKIHEIHMLYAMTIRPQTESLTIQGLQEEIWLKYDKNCYSRLVINYNIYRNSN